MCKRDKGSGTGATPFLTDTTTLYRRARHTLFDYLDTAAKNGFTRETMGCTTKETKLAMHSSKAKPKYDQDKCTLCLKCIRICPVNAFYQKNRQIYFQLEKCIGCGECIAICPSEAITVPWGSVLALDVQKGLMDGFKGVTSVFKEKMGFVNFGFDITAHCDCPGESKLPVVPDIGILASLDVVACDKASYDLITQAPVYPGSELERKGIKAGEDKIESIYPDIDTTAYWKLCQQSGLGNLEYKLETVS